MALPTSVSLLGLALVFAYVARALWRRGRATENPDWGDVRRSIAWMWAFTVAVLIPVAAVGAPVDVAFVRPEGSLVRGWLYGFIAFGGAMALVGFVGTYTGGTAASPLTLVAIGEGPLRKTALALTIALSESVLFFGFTVETVAALTGSAALGGALAAVGSALVRINGGVAAVLEWLPGALALAGVAVWTRSMLVFLPILFFYVGLTLFSADPEQYDAA